MGSLSRSESGTLSEDYSHYSGYSHGSVPSTLADLLERFTVEAQPDCTLKLRSACVRGPAAGIQALTGLWDDRSRPMGARCLLLPAAAANNPSRVAHHARSAGPLVLGADLTRVMAAKTNTAALVVSLAVAAAPPGAMCSPPFLPAPISAILCKHTSTSAAASPAPPADQAVVWGCGVVAPPAHRQQRHADAAVPQAVLVAVHARHHGACQPLLQILRLVVPVRFGLHGARCALVRMGRWRSQGANQHFVGGRCLRSCPARLPLPPAIQSFLPLPP